MEPKLLGKGGYGAVVQQGNVAVKQFKKHRHLIQEVYVLAYLKDCPHILQVKGCDFDNLTMRMQLWDCSLQDVLKNVWSGREVLSLSCKHAIFKSALMGIAYTHSRKLVHADFKPSNILVNKDRTLAVVSDCGLTSISNRARTDLTTQVFSPTDVEVKYRSHDMFGVALVGIELFGGYRVHRALSTKELHNLIKEFRESSMDSKLKSCLCAMATTDPAKCIRANEVIKILYQKTVPEVSTPDVNIDKLLSANQLLQIETDTKALCKKYDIHRGKRCSRCTMTLLSSMEKVDKYKIRFYSTVMCFVFSSIFGNVRMKLEQVLEELGHANTEKLNAALSTIVSVPQVLSLIYAA